MTLCWPGSTRPGSWTSALPRNSWFVLHELLGYPSVANYDGSWTEYGSLVGVPVERSGVEDS